MVSVRIAYKTANTLKLEFNFQMYIFLYYLKSYFPMILCADSIYLQLVLWQINSWRNKWNIRESQERWCFPCAWLSFKSRRLRPLCKVCSFINLKSNVTKHCCEVKTSTIVRHNSDVIVISSSLNLALVFLCGILEFFIMDGICKWTF